jgi:signal transduction histidine kinase
VRPIKLLRSSTFRITLFYAGIFAASAMILLGFVYWTVGTYMERQLELSVTAEVDELISDAGAPTAPLLAQAVARLIQRSPQDPAILRVDDGHGHVLAGNMPELALFDPIGDGWLTAAAPSKGDKEGDTRRFRIKAVTLSDGGRLLVGAGTHQLEEVGELVLRAALSGLVVTGLLAAAGGILMSARVHRRVEAINRTSREIIAGDLSRRIPTRGANDDYDQLAANLNAMLDRIAALMEGLRQVSNDIAHDLRTPLTRLRNRLDAARTKALTAEAYADVVEHAIEEVDAVLATFGALLRIAQIEAGTRRIGFSEVDLADILRFLVEVYEVVAEEAGQLLVSTIAEPAVVQGDRDLLLQMFSNLLENALRHTPQGTRIELRLTADANGFAVAISDNGPGIPTEFHDKVFQRFYRLDSSRSTPGNGLGLSLVAAIASLHGLRIQLADNRPGLKIVVAFAASRRERVRAAAGTGNSGSE